MVRHIAQHLKATQLPFPALRRINRRHLDISMYRGRVIVDKLEGACDAVEAPLDGLRGQTFSFDMPPQGYQPLGGDINVRLRFDCIEDFDDAGVAKRP